ncbi:hypothetical protein YC2023_080896 [Brassica napus]
MHQRAVNLSKFDGNLFSSSLPSKSKKKTYLNRSKSLRKKSIQLINEIYSQMKRNGKSEYYKKQEKLLEGFNGMVTETPAPSPFPTGVPGRGVYDTHVYFSDISVCPVSGPMSFSDSRPVSTMSFYTAQCETRTD